MDLTLTGQEFQAYLDGFFGAWEFENIPDHEVYSDIKIIKCKFNRDPKVYGDLVEEGEEYDPDFSYYVYANCKGGVYYETV